MQETLKNNIIQMTNLLEQTKAEWQTTYDKTANILLDNRDILKKFHRSCKPYLEYLHFYIIEVSTTLPTLFKITIKYLGQPIADVILAKDNTTITTEPYNNTNKDLECDIKLKEEQWNSKTTQDFLEYFRKATIKNKGYERARTEGLLLNEFSKTSSVEKLLIGIQPILQQDFIYPIPVIINKDKPEYINILTRSKVRKITLIEVMDEADTPETVLNRATKYATVLLNLLHSDSGDQYYKLFGFHGRNPVAHTIKVVIAINKKLSSKYKEHEPIQISIGADTIDIYPLYYEIDKDNTKITNIKTDLNNKISR